MNAHMTKAIVVRQTGGPEVLKLEDWLVGEPGRGQVRVRHEAIGLNFLDVYHRTGLYPLPLPFVPGNEAAGVITAIGDGVSGFSVGDRVCCRAPIGTYCGERVMPAADLIAVPDNVSFGEAAASILKGLTACYLLEMTAQLKPGDTILFHAAAGGVGQIAVQWAKSLGVRVIGTVGSDAKVELAKALGCDSVINISKVDFAPEVRRLTDGQGVDVVYDSIGKDSFEASLDSLKRRGLMVSFGNSSGPVSMPTLGVLAAKGSLYVTRPTLASYFTNAAESAAGASRLFGLIEDGTIKINIGQSWPLAEAASAHIALESRQTTGSSLLMP